MSVGAWVLIYVLGSIICGAVLAPTLRKRREGQELDEKYQPPPPAYVVRDERLDIETALRRRR